MKVFIGLKLHSVILATCAFVPSIMLEYQPKCLDYMLSINQRENCYRTDKLYAHKITESLMELSNKRDYYSVKLRKSINELKGKQNMYAEEIKQLINL